MIRTIRYRVSHISLGAVHGAPVEATSPDAIRLLGWIDEGHGADFLPECRRGDVIEIDYDDSEDRRGIAIDARKI